MSVTREQTGNRAAVGRSSGDLFGSAFGTKGEHLSRRPRLQTFEFGLGQGALSCEGANVL